MPLAHPQKHLIRDLWPDKHLYAALLLLLAALIGGGFAVVAYVVPVTFARDLPTDVAGWNWPFGILLPAIAFPLAVASYRMRRPWMGFVAAGIELVSVGALGVSSLLAIAAIGFLLRARAEEEHLNPATRDLHPHHWPDKSLAASLLFVVATIGLLVWGSMLLSGSVSVRSMDLTLWGIASLLAAVVAGIGAVFCYRQRTYGACVAAAVAVALSFGFVIVGPALAIGAGLLLYHARREGEFEG